MHALHVVLCYMHCLHTNNMCNDCTRTTCCTVLYVMIVYALRSGGRMDEAIVCWDARSSRAPLATYSRPGLTNQRISFDIDPTGR
jgi:hypothetical protein